MLILDGVPGRVVVLRTNPAAGLVRFISINPVLSFDTHRVLITRVGVSRGCNYQLLHSLGDVVYVYVFGDRVGQIVIHGLAMSGPISYGAGCQFESGSGLDNVLAYFDQNRIAGVSPNREVEVIVGTTPIRGFLTDAQLDVLNPEFQMAEFSLVIKTVPEIVPRGGRANGSAPSNVMTGPLATGLPTQSPATVFGVPAGNLPVISVDGQTVQVTPESGTSPITVSQSSPSAAALTAAAGL